MDEKQDGLLIVEDNIDKTDILNDFFRAKEYAVYTVNRGEDAIHHNLYKRLKHCFIHYSRDLGRDSGTFRRLLLAVGFFTIQPCQTFSREIAQMRNALANICQASTP